MFLETLNEIRAQAISQKKIVNWKLLVLCEISTHLLYMNEGFVSF